MKSSITYDSHHQIISPNHYERKLPPQSIKRYSKKLHEHINSKLKICNNPPPFPNNSIHRKVGSNVLYNNKHLRLAGNRQNVLVRNAIGRNG
jgi:hypothetical protein